MRTKKQIEEKMERLSEIGEKRIHIRSLEADLFHTYGFKEQMEITIREQVSLNYHDIRFFKEKGVNTSKIKNSLLILEELAWGPCSELFRLLYQRCLISPEGDIIGNSISSPVVSQDPEILELAYEKLPELLDKMGKN